MEIERRGGAPDALLGPSLAEVRKIAIQLNAIAGLSMDAISGLSKSKVEPSRSPTDRELVKLAENELGWRKRRNSAFGQSALFGEPTWELLLDLFLQSARGSTVTVTSACIASGVPTTTALRYLSAMIDAGFIERKPNAMDGRMHLVHLTDVGRTLVRESLESWYLMRHEDR